MGAKEEVAKAAERGQHLDRNERKLEELRERLHSASATEKDRKEFKQLSAKVAGARAKARKRREAKGPPVPAKPGDAVVRVGGVS
jgi:hypothetical protein